MPKLSDAKPLLQKCEGCGNCEGMLHYKHKNYHFLVSAQEGSNDLWFAAIDAKDGKRVTMSVPTRPIVDFESEFEKEIIESVEQFKSSRV